MDTIDELQRAVGRIEAKVDILLKRDDRNDERISAVEKKVWYGAGIGSLVALILPSVLGKYFG